MSHIVIDARESGTSTGRYIDKLVEHLHSLQPQYRITLLAKQKRVAYLQKIAPDFNVVVTPYKEFTFGEQLGFRRQIARLRPDLVHFGMVQQPLLYRGRVITTMHDLTTLRFRNPAKNAAVFWTKQQVYKLVNVIAAHKSARILVPSKFVRDDVAAYCRVPLSKIMVTYEAADPLPPGSAPYAPVRNAPFIMYIGRPTPHKNLGRLIDAFVLLQKTHPNLHLVLAGKKDANYAHYESIVAKRSIKNVVFTDLITDKQYRWLLEHCRAYVFPSLSEGFGLPGLEAMQHGAPVVSSNATCLPEVLGDAAHYFNPLDAQDMANAISVVLTDSDIRTRLIQKGKARAASYSWQHMAQQTLNAYIKVLNTQ
jgi:glycosyltransferase involved in cell wall biosynthesis